MVCLIAICLASFSNPASARDEVGDLNAAYVEHGDFAGSFKVNGSNVPVSIALGGFIKAVAITDSNSERDDVYFRPSLLTANDEEGHFQINANFSRWYIDTRAALDSEQKFRAYIEADFYNAPNFRMRHAFLSWTFDDKELVAGQTWTTFMDVSAFPEMIYELGPAGGILLRQGQFRFSQKFSDAFTFSMALEDPSASDLVLTGDERGITNMPDLTANLRTAFGSSAHLQLALLGREIAFDDNTLNQSDSAFAYGWHLSAAKTFANKDKLAFSFLSGDGIGRYIIGSTAQAAVIDAGGDILLRQSSGGYVSYKHFWNERWRSNLVGGGSNAEVFSSDAAGVFEKAYFVSVNVFWQVNKVLNTGLEYSYGEADFKGTDSRDNSRVSFVVQLF
jgi:hypothetical protein